MKEYKALKGLNLRDVLLLRLTWRVTCLICVVKEYVWHVSYAWWMRICDMSNMRHVEWGLYEALKGCILWNAAFKVLFACHAYERVMSHVHKWVMSHIWSHVTHVNESCHTYEWIMSRNTHCNTHCNTHIRYEWAMSHIEWVMAHTYMSHVTRMNESCHLRTPQVPC